MPKISAKLNGATPNGDTKMQVGWVKIGDFLQITRYNWKT